MVEAVNLEAAMAFDSAAEDTAVDTEAVAVVNLVAKVILT